VELGWAAGVGLCSGGVLKVEQPHVHQLQLDFKDLACQFTSSSQREVIAQVLFYFGLGREETFGFVFLLGYNSCGGIQCDTYVLIY
jgi:hypothetical protein